VPIVTDDAHESPRAPPPPEEALRKQAAFRDALIRTAAEGICVCHAVAEYPFVAFTVWNDRMTELTGYTMEEINRLGWYQTMYPDPELQARAVARMQAMRVGIDLGLEEWTVTRKDGVTRTLAISTSVVEMEDRLAVVALMQDVTDRRRAEAALRDSEERLRLTLDAARMIAYEIELPGGRVAFSSDPAAFYRAAERDYTEPGACLLLAHPDDRERIRAEMERGVREGSEFSAEFRGAGGAAWYSTRARLVPESAGRPARILGVSAEITRRKQAEDEARQLREKLEQSRRLESLGVLAGGIAHNFNNLLTVILGYAELALDQLEDRSPLEEPLREIGKAGRRAAELCRQVLISAGQRPNFTDRLDLAEAVAAGAELLRESLPADRWQPPRSPAGVPPVRADADQLRQAVLSLVANAVEAVEQGGEVTILTGTERLARTRLDQLHLGDGLPEGEYAFLEVADAGRGMDEATRARLFEPFFSTKFAGRGLGLPAVFGVARSHGGAVEVRSAPGRGTTMRLYLPAAGG
jgi:PAS domain S-box-containing protein